MIYPRGSINEACLSIAFALMITRDSDRKKTRLLDQIMNVYTRMMFRVPRKQCFSGPGSLKWQNSSLLFTFGP